MLVLHAVYGLRIATNIALPGVPLQLDSDAYDVRIRLKDWATFPTGFADSVDLLYTSVQDAEPGQPHLRVGVLPGGEYFGFFYSDEVRFAVERKGREVWGDWPENYTLEDACTYLLGPVIGFVLRLRGVTCLHASAVALGEYAIALTGFAGAGKSTTAAAFARSGFPVIADDVVALQEQGKDFLVHLGYRRVNLWPDSTRALFGSEDTLPRITPTWDKRYMALADDSGFDAKPCPLGAIYLLVEREAGLAAPVVEEVAGGDAVALLVANTYVNYLLDRDMRSREFDVLTRLVAGIPVRRVRCPNNPAAVFDVCRAIAADARRVMKPIPSAASRRGSNV